MDLVNFISRRPRSLRDITSRLAISERTAVSCGRGGDIASLASIAPLTRDDAGYRLLETATLRPLNLTPEEHAVLKVALHNPSLRRTPALLRRLERLEAKLDAAMAHLEETSTAPAFGNFLSIVDHDVKALTAASTFWPGPIPWARDPRESRFR